MNTLLKQMLKLTSCLMVCSITSSCTVLGFAADIGLANVLEPVRDANTSAASNQKVVNRSRNQFPLVFTVEGMKQDAKIISGFLGSYKASASDTQESESQPQKVTGCNHVIEGKQQCYPSSYYQDMYINTSSGEKEF
ncbi:MAG: hypothetical protein ABJJ44_02505 [Paraglaciecola sp.]|uniref:hypothetical protein n=1 Tax=Paraglaciecola sp. TaxID=1920173 RepID=UPI0032985687